MADKTNYLVYNENDQYIQFALKNGLTQDNIIDAVVTATLYDRSGVIVSAAFTDVACAYVAGALYRGFIEETFIAPDGGGYYALIVGSTPGGLNIKVRKKFKVAERTD